MRLSHLAAAAAAGLSVSGTTLAGETVAYEVAGASYDGYLAAAEGEARGLVVIVHDWDGLTDYEERRAEMLAALGYDAFALDLYGAGNRPDTTEAKKAEVGKLYRDREAMRERLLAGLDEARRQSGGSEAVVMGYCFGGAAILELARSGEAEDVKGYASFHGGLKTPEGQSYPQGTPPILIAHGGADGSISIDDAAELAKTLEETGVPYTLEIYSGAPHAFTVFGSDAYREGADAQSWTSFKGLLDRQL